jgi:hypothetical protein
VSRVWEEGANDLATNMGNARKRKKHRLGKSSGVFVRAMVDDLCTPYELHEHTLAQTQTQ